MNGTGDPEYLGWTGRLCQMARRRGHDVTYYNLGVRGDSSLDIAKRWREETARRLPDEPGHLVFSFGTNDAYVEDGTRIIPLTTTLTVTSQILEEAQQVHQVLMVGPPPISSNEENVRIREISENLGKLCARLQIPYLESFASLGRNSTWLEQVELGDGDHPQAAGYAVWAQLVDSWEAWRAWVP